jgi:hypothetical protein
VLHFRYCGCQRDLTLDHVVPVSLGGVNSWTNLVTACMACNQRKGNKSLAQLGWSLPCLPREPTPQEVGVIAGISKVRGERRQVVSCRVVVCYSMLQGLDWSLPWHVCRESQHHKRLV